jgi:hypothetical protein
VNNFNVTSAKLTGNPDSLGWAQVLEFKPEDPEKLSSRGHLFAVIATKNQEIVSENLEAVSAGREILTRLNEEYFGNLETSAFNALEKAIKKVLAENLSTGEVEIAAVAYVGDVVYSAAGGGAQVAIFRNNMLAKILVSPIKEVVCASGYPQNGDLLIIGTSIFFGTVAVGVLKASLEGGNPETAIEALAPTIHSCPNIGSLGTVVIKFSKEEFIEVPKEAAQKIPQFFSGKIFNNLKSIPAKLINSLGSLIPERKIYIKGEEISEEGEKNRKTTVTIGIILLVLLGVSIGFGIRAKMIKDAKARYAPILQTAQHEFDEAESLYSVDPSRARALLIDSRDKVNQLISQKISDSAITALKNKITEKEGTILGEYKIEPELFIDLSLLTSGFKADLITTSNDKIFILNKDGKRIVSVALDNKKSQVVAGPDQVDEATNIAAYEDRVFILNNEGIYEVGEAKTKIIDKDWEGEVIPYAYTGNFYVLDKVAGTIWRYSGPPAGGGEKFGSRQNWLAAGTKVDFSNAKTMAIDGTILVLISTSTPIKSGSKVLKFSLGSPQNFNISGVSPDLVTIDSIYTNEELKYIYLLDKTNKRVVVLEKNGNFKAQYLADKIGEAINLSVSEKEKKIILVTSDKLYSIEIKHL